MRNTMETFLNFKESDILFTNGGNEMSWALLGIFSLLGCCSCQNSWSDFPFFLRLMRMNLYF